MHPPRLTPALTTGATGAACLVLALPLLAGCSSDRSTGIGAPIGSSASVQCTYRPAGEPARPVDPPDTRGVPTSGHESLELATNRGDITMTLHPDESPCAVNSMTALAEQRFFDQTPCHRLTTEPSGIFVLQCGDPTGTGLGGPGYAFDDEIKPGQTYPAGTVALANPGQPNTNGSQFFLVYEDSPLPAKYTPVATLTPEGGLATVRAIAAKGTDNSRGPGDGSPREDVTILTARATTS